MRTYDVMWHMPGSGPDTGTYRSRVVVNSEWAPHPTTEDDIPAIIATSRTGDPSLAYLVIIDSLTLVD
jgi:hypothetical protein